jgi:hypothetical protein
MGWSKGYEKAPPEGEAKTEGEAFGGRSVVGEVEAEGGNMGVGKVRGLEWIG